MTIRRFRPALFIGSAGVLACCSLAALAQSKERKPDESAPLAGPGHRANDDERHESRAGDEVDAGLDEPPSPNLIGPPGPGPGRFADRLSDEDFDEMLRFLDQHFPERAQELRWLRDENNPRFRVRAGRMFPRLRQLMMELRDDPESGRLAVENERLEMKVRGLAQEYAGTPESDEPRRTQLRRQMRAMLDEQFDVRQQRMQREIARLEQRLGSLRERIENQQQRRDVMIDTRLDNLLYGAPMPPFDDPPQRPGRRPMPPRREE